MKSGQVFKVDAQALSEMAAFYKRPESDFSKLNDAEFSIANSKVTSAVTSTEVRCTKWEDGKPKRGRPRKFPRSTVARLLGETNDPSLTGETETPSSEVQVEEVSEATVEVETVEDVDSEELLAAAEAAIASSDDDGSDW